MADNFETDNSVALPVTSSNVWPMALLRFSVACELWGLAGRRFYNGLESPIGDWFFHDRGWSEQAMLQLEDGAAWFFLLAGIVTVWRVSWFVVIPATVWLVTLPFVQWMRDDGFFPALEPGEQAVRALAPLALLLLESARRSGDAAWRGFFGIWLLRIAVGSTFACHGLAAIWHHPGFIDLLLTADTQIWGLGLSESQACVMLDVIGYIDIAVAIGIVFTRWKMVAAYMAFWGLITAASRVVALGGGGVPEMLVRVPHFVVPCLLLLWATAGKVKDETKTGNESV